MSKPRQYLNNHTVVKRILALFAYLSITFTVIPASAYASMTVFAEFKPTCGLVNLIRAPIEKVMNDIIGLIGLAPTIIGACVVIGFLGAQFDVGKKAFAFAGKLSFGTIVVSILGAVISLWLVTTCAG